MMPAGQIIIGEAHPSLPGHFPGRPIVPGVLLLAEVFARLAEAHPGFAVAGLQQAKFLRPLRPGEIMALTSRMAEGGDVHFTGAIGEAAALRGVARMRPA
jgi:3-hydroxymyristoyl/3-hydroxydecanoyl-(acyl carrier protein) dehydratase